MLGGDDDHLQSRLLAHPRPLARIEGLGVEKARILAPFTPLAIGEGIDAKVGKGNGLELLPGVLARRGGHTGGPEDRGFHLLGRRGHLQGGSRKGEGKQH